MITSDLPSADAFVGDLSENGLLSAEQLERVNRWRLASPRAASDGLANFLVEEQILTRFQADTILEGASESLSLSAYTLVDVIGSGSMGTVYRARAAGDDNWYAIKV